MVWFLDKSHSFPVSYFFFSHNPLTGLLRGMETAQVRAIWAPRERCFRNPEDYLHNYECLGSPSESIITLATISSSYYYLQFRWETEAHRNFKTYLKPYSSHVSVEGFKLRSAQLQTLCSCHGGNQVLQGHRIKALSIWWRFQVRLLESCPQGWWQCFLSRACTEPRVCSSGFRVFQRKQWGSYRLLSRCGHSHSH